MLVFCAGKAVITFLIETQHCFFVGAKGSNQTKANQGFLAWAGEFFLGGRFFWCFLFVVLFVLFF